MEGFFVETVESLPSVALWIGAVARDLVVEARNAESSTGTLEILEKIDGLLRQLCDTADKARIELEERDGNAHQA